MGRNGELCGGFCVNGFGIGFGWWEFDLWKSMWKTFGEVGNWVGFCWRDWDVGNSVGFVGKLTGGESVLGGADLRNMRGMVSFNFAVSLKKNYPLGTGIFKAFSAVFSTRTYPKNSNFLAFCNTCYNRATGTNRTARNGTNLTRLLDT